jgi:hypothetical protein
MVEPTFCSPHDGREVLHSDARGTLLAAFEDCRIVAIRALSVKQLLSARTGTVR